MTSKRNVLKTLLLLSGLFLLIAGVLLFGKPLETMISLAIVMGLAILVAGIVDLVLYFITESTFRSPWGLIRGILTILISLWILFGENTRFGLSALLPFLFSIWVIASSVTRIIASFSAKKWGDPKWWIPFVLGIIGIILGIVLLLDPLYSASILSVLIPLLLLYQGLNHLSSFFFFK